MRFLAFRNNYLTVYALMMAGDWLQGKAADAPPFRLPSQALMALWACSFALTTLPLSLNRFLPPSFLPFARDPQQLLYRVRHDDGR